MGNRPRRYLMGVLLLLLCLFLSFQLARMSSFQEDEDFLARSSAGSELQTTLGTRESDLSRESANTTARLTVELDRFGGFNCRIARPAKFFRLEKIDNRWWIIDPLGNAFWMKSIYNIEPYAVGGDKGIAEKYGNRGVWTRQVLQRLKAWGFNTTGEYSHNLVRSYGTWGGGPNPMPVPAIALITPARDALNNFESFSPTGPIKDIIAGVPKSTYNDWRAPLIDIFDPSFAVVARRVVQYLDRSVTGGVAQQRWIVGITMDDADDLYGFKGPGTPGHKVQYPHPGLMVLTTKFHYAGYRDPVLHSKYALRDHLKEKYKTVDSLNTAWGSNYTSWESDGGHAIGAGFLDEDGQNSWVGRDPYLLRGASAKLRRDLDEFLFIFATRYFKTVHDAIRAVDKNHLIFGPAALNNYGLMTRPQILQAGAPFVDAFQFNYDVDPTVREPMAGVIASYDLVGKPAFIWLGITANRDSDLASFPQPYGMPEVPTQELRGRIFERAVNTFLAAKGSNGDYFVVGLDFWSWGNKWSEKANWGLVSFKDNAFNGTEAIIAHGTDPWGFSTGGEKTDYGDFLSGVTKANNSVAARLAGTHCGVTQARH